MEKLTTDSVITGLAVLTIAAQIASLILLAALVFGKKVPRLRAITTDVGKHALALSLIVLLVGMLGSLYLSEIKGLNPCKLCWYQRILLYPQVLMLLIAIKKRDYGVMSYCLGLSGIGATVALYHYATQMMNGFQIIAPCTTNPEESCTRKMILEFGYITIPLMAFTAFVFSILCLISRKSTHR